LAAKQVSFLALAVHSLTLGALAKVAAMGKGLIAASEATVGLSVWTERSLVQNVQYFIVDLVPIHGMLACQAPSLKAPTRRIPAVGNGGGIVN